MATARSHVYAFLAQSFAAPDPPTHAWLRRALPVVEAALTTIGATRSRGVFAAVRAEFTGLNQPELAAAHSRVFGHLISGDCPPYEGEYGNAHIFQKTQCLADNAGFFEAFGLAAAPDLADRLDHIAIELEFLHVLAAKEAHALAYDHGEARLAVVQEATRKYFAQHLGRWAPAFAAQLESKAKDGLYAALARMLAAFVADETHALGVTPGESDAAPMVLQADDGAVGCEGCAKAALLDGTR